MASKNSHSTEEIRKKKQRIWENYEASYNDVMLVLAPKYFDIMEKIIKVVQVCDSPYLLHYLKAAANRTVYFVERCKLLYNGKCCESYQVTMESGHLLPASYDKTTFSKNGEDTALPFGSTLQALTLRSYLGVIWAKAVKGDMNNLRYDDMGVTIEHTLIKAYALFETDLSNVLYYRKGIASKGLILHMREYPHQVKIRFTAQFVKDVANKVSEEAVWETPLNYRFFSRNNKMDHVIKTDVLSPAHDKSSKEVLYDHVTLMPDVFTAKGAAEPPRQKADDTVVPVDVAAIAATNAKLGLGSRKKLLVPQSRDVNAAASPCASFDDNTSHDPYALRPASANIVDADRLVSTVGPSTPVVRFAVEQEAEADLDNITTAREGSGDAASPERDDDDKDFRLTNRSRGTRKRMRLYSAVLNADSDSTWWNKKKGSGDDEDGDDDDDGGGSNCPQKVAAHDPEAYTIKKKNVTAEVSSSRKRNRYNSNTVTLPHDETYVISSTPKSSAAQTPKRKQTRQEQLTVAIYNKVTTMRGKTCSQMLTAGTMNF